MSTTQAKATESRDLRQLVGTTIADRYRVDEVLGEGGMGLIFRAHHLLLKRDVAIKVLHPELSDNPQLSARFDREAQSAARLEHPNIVHVSEFGSTEQGMKYMVMQLLEGCELERLVGKDVPLDPLRAIDLAIQIFRGLEHAHKHGVVHRDLKPENIFVTQDHEARETLKIVDFGIAKIVASDDDAPTARPLTRHGLVFGTPEYMSPEQAMGIEVDARSDLYSAGVILYEMLAGRRPFVNEDKVALIRMQAASDPPPFELDLPEGIAHLVFDLLAKERESRPESATEVIDELEAIREELGAGIPSRILPAHTRPPRDDTTTAVAPVSYPAAPPQSIWERLKIPLVVALVTGTISAGVVWTLGERRDEVRTDAAPTPQAEDGATGSALDPSSFAAIDREILAKRGDEALDLIKPLKDKFPKEAQLHWREGQALALARGNKDALALIAYGDALEEDPKLLEEPDFYAQLYELLRKRKLREQALDLALQKMGDYGNKFLLELVNEANPNRALDYADRHRALDALFASPESSQLVDRRLNLARDLWQSARGRSPKPCANFRQAVADIDAVADVYFAPGVGRAEVPKPGDDEDASACEGIEPQLEALEQKLAAMEEVEAPGEGTAGGPGGGSEDVDPPAPSGE